MPFFARLKFDTAIEEMILESPAPGKHAARSAIRHLEKANDISPLDPEMAAFRAITAEEEAATALIHTLKRRGYEGAERLRPRNHVHKSALSQLLEAIQGIFAEADRALELRPRLRVLEDEKPRRIQLELHGARLGLGEVAIVPIPPLHFQVQSGDDPTSMAVHDFSRELEEFASIKGATSVLSHLKKRANLRNQILYASTEGVPNVQLNNFLEKQRSIVKTLLTAYLMIDPYEDKQLFVQQSLGVLVRMLELLPKAAYSSQNEAT